MLQYNAHKLKDFYHLENVSLARPTQELSMVEKLAHQIFAPKDRKLKRTEDVKIALTILEQPVIVKVANHKCVPPDRFSKLMDVVLNAIHTQEPLQMEKSVSHTTVLTYRKIGPDGSCVDCPAFERS